MHALKLATPGDLLDSGHSPTDRAVELHDTSPSEVLGRGQHFFAKTYGKVADQIMGSMTSSSEDLSTAALLNYSYILSNTKVLSARESSLALLAGLIPQDVNAQLKGHLRGALNHGSSIEEIKAVRKAIITICMASGMVKLGEDVQAGWGWRTAIPDL